MHDRMCSKGDNVELEETPDWILEMRVRNYPLTDVIREEIERRYKEITQKQNNCMSGFVQYENRTQSY